MIRVDEAPLRSVLFVPADDAGKLAKARSAGADALILDLEDSVASTRKPIARRSVSEFLTATPDDSQAIFVRFHSCSSPGFQADCALLESVSPDGIVLSKCSSADDVHQLVDTLNRHALAASCGILPLIENANGILNAHAIAAASNRVAALLFGAEDFCADTGIQPGGEEAELLFARSTVVIAGAAAGVPAIDTPFLNFRDHERLRDAAYRARRLGFAGKLAIHPLQIACLNEIFQPSEQELENARSILKSMESESAGVTSLNGQMVDRVHVRRAQRMLATRRSGPGH